MLSQLNPLIKSGFEFSANYDFFKGQPISSYPGEMKDSIFGEIDAQHEKLISMFRPAEEVAKLFGLKEKYEDLTTGERIAFFAAGKLYSYNLREQAEWAEKDIKSHISQYEKQLKQETDQDVKDKLWEQMKEANQMLINIRM